MSSPNVYLVGASEYGGPGDPSSGDVGSSGVNLTGKMAFAELGMGHLLGDLPYGTKLRIRYRESMETQPHEVIAEKLDIGMGGAPVQGHIRRVDLWYQTAKALDFKGTGLILIERVDGKAIPTAIKAKTNAKGIAKYEGSNTTTGAGFLGSGIGPTVDPEVSENVRKGVEGIGGFLGELSLKRVFMLLAALGLGGFGLYTLVNKSQLTEVMKG